MPHVHANPSTDALPRWITAEVVADTQTTWGPLYGKELTEAEAIEILLTMGNLFRVLEGGGRSNEVQPQNPDQEPAEAVRCSGTSEQP